MLRAKRHAIAELIGCRLAGWSAVKCQDEDLADHLLEMLFDRVEVLLAQLVHVGELFENLSFAVHALLFAHGQI